LPQPAWLFKSKNNADGEAVTEKGGVSAAPSKLCSDRLNQAMMLATTPAPQKSAVSADVVVASITL
jgi:hypothetical protein